MARAPGWLWPLLVSAGMVQAAVYLARPMISYRLLDGGADGAQLGLVAASFSVAPLVLALPVGRWLDRHDAKVLIVLGGALIAVASFGLVAAAWLWLVLLASAVLGAGQLIAVVAAQTLIANRAGPGEHDQRYGAFTVAASIGQLVGPGIGSLLATGAVAGAAAGPGATGRTVALSMACAGVLGALAMVVSLAVPSVPPWHRAAHEQRISGVTAVRQVLARPGVPQAVLIGVLLLTSMDILLVFLPALAREKGVGIGMVTVLLALRAAFSMLSRLLLTRLLALLGRGWLLVTSLFGSGVGICLMPFAGSGWWLLLVMAVSGFGLGIGQPITMSWVANAVTSSLAGTAMALRLTGNRLGQILMPVAAGLLARSAGASVVFLSTGVLLGASAVIGRSADVQRDRRP